MYITDEGICVCFVYALTFGAYKDPFDMTERRLREPLNNKLEHVDNYGPQGESKYVYGK